MIIILLSFGVATIIILIILLICIVCVFLHPFIRSYHKVSCDGSVCWGHEDETGTFKSAQGVCSTEKWSFTLSRNRTVATGFIIPANQQWASCPSYSYICIINWDSVYQSVIYKITSSFSKPFSVSVHNFTFCIFELMLASNLTTSMFSISSFVVVIRLFVYFYHCITCFKYFMTFLLNEEKNFTAI